VKFFASVFTAYGLHPTLNPAIPLPILENVFSFCVRDMCKSEKKVEIKQFI
jgi:hypothetical protein